MSLFRSASFRLTVFYVLIVMAISIGFSSVVYQLSKREISTCMSRPATFINQLPADNPIRSLTRDLERMRSEQLETSSGHLLSNLVYLNILILLLSSVGSYFFARWTLEPIEETLEAQSRFTADASHELKTPLTAMKSEIEVNLRDKKLTSSEARDLLKSNLEEIGKLEALSNALLDLARLERKTSESFQEISLPEVVTGAYEKVEKLALSKKISFENKFQQIKTLADKDSLQELFVILLDNAIKYSPKNSKIFITIQKELRHGEIIVKDQGQGISREDLPHIFDRFYRADSARSKDKTGSYGLGLAIAKNITELHGGTISVKSNVGKGSTFIVKLPLS